MKLRPIHGDASRTRRRLTPHLLLAATLSCWLICIPATLSFAADPAPKKPTARPSTPSPNEKAAAKIAADKAAAAKKAATAKPVTTAKPETSSVVVPGAKAVWPASKNTPKNAATKNGGKALKEGKAKWPGPPKDPNDTDGVIAIEGGIVGPDGSVTVGGLPDAPAKTAAATPSPSPSKNAAEAQATLEETPTLEGGEASDDGEVALDLGADLENAFNPYVFDRGPGWIMMPVFALMILGLHLIPVPKRKMKKLIAQTGLFRGLPGKEDTKTGANTPPPATDDDKTTFVPPAAAVASETKAAPPAATASAAKRRFSSSGSMLAATGEPAPAKRPPTPAPIDSIARELEKDAEDERTRLYVKRGRNGEEEES